MSELPPVENQKKQELGERLILLAKELSGHPEGFTFPGVSEETLKKLKAVDEEYPEHTIPTDEIIARMKSEGIKIVFGEHQESGNVFVLPLLSDDISLYSLFPRHLDTTSEMNESLKLLILTHKAIFKLESKEV